MPTTKKTAKKTTNRPTYTGRPEYKHRPAFVWYETPKGVRKTREGIVIQHTPWEEGKPESVTIRYKNGAEETMPVGIPRIELAKSRIPKAWKKVLRENKDVKGIQHIGVCYRPYCSPVSTTLFDRRNGLTLEYTTSETNGSTVHLWEGDEKPQESKPETHDSNTIYHVGRIELDMDVVYYS